MRLLHASSFQLKSFQGDTIPPYVILSHTWGEDEVSFQDIHGPNASSKAGFTKIQLICSHALEHGLQYVWVDTCCIDKTSSAELSEAINSMFRWYQESIYCYAYLADVPDGTDVHSPSSAFATSRWFSRGWTLQELLAPIYIVFFSSGGQELGTRQTLSGKISSITLIGEEYLLADDPHSLLSQASIAKRMSWCSRRRTTRIGDIAYCLLGIFGISMPLLYGEGERAFVRLQEEIMKVSNDQSLFAWGYESYNTSASLFHFDHSDMRSLGPFAKHPSSFKNSGHFVPDEFEPPNEAFASTNMGLQITLRVVEKVISCGVAILACRPENQYTCLVGIKLRFHSMDSFTRLPGSCWIVQRDKVADWPYCSLRFLTNYIPPRDFLEQFSVRDAYLIRRCKSNYTGGDLTIWDVEPHDVWDSKQRIFSLRDQSHVLLRVRRRNGDGYAIVLEHVSNTGGWVGYCVFRETPSQPRRYEFYSRTERNEATHRDIWTSDIMIKEGLPVSTKEHVSLRMIDIEHGEMTTNHIDVGSPALTTKNIRSMRPMTCLRMRWGKDPGTPTVR